MKMPKNMEQDAAYTAMMIIKSSMKAKARSMQQSYVTHNKKILGGVAYVMIVACPSPAFAFMLLLMLSSLLCLHILLLALLFLRIHL